MAGGCLCTDQVARIEGFQGSKSDRSDLGVQSKLLLGLAQFLDRYHSKWKIGSDVRQSRLKASCNRG